MTTPRLPAGQLTPEDQRRLANLSKHWEGRISTATSDADLARLCWERAKAAARRAQRSGRNARAMHDLATLVAAWAQQQELDDIRARGDRA